MRVKRISPVPVIDQRGVSVLILAPWLVSLQLAGDKFPPEVLGALILVNRVAL